MADNIETSFQAAIDNGKINGAVICVTDLEGRFVYNKTFGERTLLSGEKKPHQIDDVLYVASATKLMATIAALQCVEDGLLTLTGDLSSITPELATKQVIARFTDDDKTPLMEPQTNRITLEMLLTHSSGASYDFLTPPVARWRREIGPPQEERRRQVEESFDYPLSFQPGTGWMYGPGLDWAGRIVERVTGHTLGEQMQQRIFGPLGITDAQFYPVTREDLRARQVDLNPKDPEGLGLAVLGGSAINKRTKGDFGGQGIFLPGSDYTKVLHSLLANDGKLLKPATVDSMFQHQLSPEATSGHQTAIAGPLGVPLRLGLDLKTKLGYGLGGQVTLEDTEDSYGEGTLCWGGGLTFAWFIDRKNNLCGTCAPQATLPVVDAEVMGALKRTFREDIYRKHNAWKEQQ